MYEKYYGMANTPFSRNIPPEKLYESPAMADRSSAVSTTRRSSVSWMRHICWRRKRSKNFILFFSFLRKLQTITGVCPRKLTGTVYTKQESDYNQGV